MKKIFVKIVRKDRDCIKNLPLALWSYQILIRVLTRFSLYSLVCNTKAMLSARLQVNSTRLLIEEQIKDKNWIRLQNEEIQLLDKRRLVAITQMQAYHKKIALAFNKRVRPRGLCEGDLESTSDLRGRFQPKWTGLYIVKDSHKGESGVNIYSMYSH